MDQMTDLDFFDGMADDMMHSVYAPDSDELEKLNESSSYEQLKDIEDRYGEASLLGEGGMKRVSRVLDQKLGVEVAFAEPRKELPSEIYEIFLQEAHLTSRLKHPNIIQVLDIGIEDKGNPYFTMELKSGLSLEYLTLGHSLDCTSSKKELSLEESLQIFVKICDAIAYAHSQGVLHLDLKPANIQVGHYGEVLVCDWGIGKVLRSSHVDGEDEEFEDEEFFLDPDYLNEVTLQVGKVRGSPGYMAPEQINGEEKTLQTDVYGLGCMLYHLCTGEKPFDGTVEQRLEATLIGDWIAPRERAPSKKISRSLEAVILKAMSTKPEDRYPSAQELREEVINVLNDHPTMAQNASVMTLLVLLYRRNRSTCLVLMSACLLLITLSVIFVKGIREQESIAHINRVKAERAVQVSGQQRHFIIKMERAYENEVANKVYTLWREGKYQASIQVCDDILSVNPSAKRVLFLKYIALFTSQRFKEAHDLYMDQINNKGLKAYEFIRESAPRCLELEKKKGGQSVLPADEFLQLLKDHQDNLVRCIHFYSFSSLYYSNLDDQFKIVQQLLIALNPLWKGESSFSKTKGVRSLKINGEGLQSLRLESFSVLKHLWLQNLDVSHSDIYDFSGLTNLNLERLVIHHTLITNLQPINQMKKLKELVVAKHQFTKRQLDALPKGLKVIYE
jgi:serine/threonine protein kinase